MFDRDCGTWGFIEVHVLNINKKVNLLEIAIDDKLKFDKYKCPSTITIILANVILFSNSMLDYIICVYK